MPDLLNSFVSLIASKEASLELKWLWINLFMDPIIIEIYYDHILISWNFKNNWLLFWRLIRMNSFQKSFWGLILPSHSNTYEFLTKELLLWKFLLNCYVFFVLFSVFHLDAYIKSRLPWDFHMARIDSITFPSLY